MKEIDLDRDGSVDFIYTVESDRVNRTAYQLDYEVAHDRCVAMAAQGARIGFRERERVGLGSTAPYVSNGTFFAVTLLVYGWMDICQPDPYGCFVYTDPGGDFATNTVAYVGMRLTQADGTHFAWVKFSRPCNWPWVAFELESFALHPLPNTPIPAGVVPQPELVVERGPGTVTLSWRPEWQGYRLEWVQQLEPDVAWKPVAGVVDHRVTLPASSVTGYFRLIKSP